MKYKIIPDDIVKNLIEFIDEIQFEAAESNKKEDILSESLIIVDTKDMSREELEQFANRMRIDRNSFLLDKEQLETELYFCYRNNKIEELVDG